MDLMAEEGSRFGQKLRLHPRGPRIMIPQQLIAAKSQELHQIVDAIVTLVADAVGQPTSDNSLVMQ